jgi:hypothetical protein
MGRDWIWPARDCFEAVGAYAAQKFTKTGLSLPPDIEAAMLSAMANMLIEDPVEGADADGLFRRARLELVGQLEKQSYITSCVARRAAVNPIRLMSPWKGGEEAPHGASATDSW